MIDHKTGDLGVTVEDEKTGKALNLAFKADPIEIYVSNPQNQPLDFSDIQVGDHLNIYTELDAHGREVPTDIYDTSRYE